MVWLYLLIVLLLGLVLWQFYRNLNLINQTVTVTVNYENVSEQMESLRQEHILLLESVSDDDQLIGKLSESVRNLESQIYKQEHDIEVLSDSLKVSQAEAKHQKGRAASAHTSKGQILEKWTPFLTHPEIDEHWTPQDWSFMGNPLDYIVWDWHQDRDLNVETGKVVFLDVKAAKSQLSTKQRRIRDLIKAGRIEWREIRLD